MRWGARMNDTQMLDMMVGALSDPFDDCHMGVTAENVAEQVEDHARGPGRAGGREPPARGATRSSKATSRSRSCRSRSRSRAARRPSTPTRTCARDAIAGEAGQAQAGLRQERHGHGGQRLGHQRRGGGGGADGTRGWPRQRGLKPLGRLVAYAHAGVEPKYMGIGPVPAVRKVLDEDRPQASTTSTCSRSTRRSPPRRWPSSRDLELPPEKHQPERQRHLARPPARRHRLHPDDQGALRAASAPAGASAGDDVHRRRAGHRGDLRTHVIADCRL